MNMSCTPLIASTFNDWRYEKMMDVVDFCLKGDINPPPFLQDLIDDGYIRNIDSEENC